MAPDLDAARRLPPQLGQAATTRAMMIDVLVALLPALGMYWLFLLSWLPITVGSFLRGTTRWEEIRHTRNVTPEALAR